jgi:hypothetical protein
MDDDAELVAILGKLLSKVNPHTFADYRIRIRPRGAATASARSSPAAAPAEFLDIDVDKLARVFALIAADRFSWRPK